MIKNFNKFCFIRPLVLVIAFVSMVGCSQMVNNTDWSEVLHDVGQDVALVNCRKVSHSPSDYFKCKENINKNYGEIEMHQKYKSDKTLKVQNNVYGFPPVPNELKQLDNQIGEIK